MVLEKVVHNFDNNATDVAGMLHDPSIDIGGYYCNMLIATNGLTDNVLAFYNRCHADANKPTEKWMLCFDIAVSHLTLFV